MGSVTRNKARIPQGTTLVYSGDPQDQPLRTQLPQTPSLLTPSYPPPGFPRAGPFFLLSLPFQDPLRHVVTALMHVPVEE